MSRLNVNAIQGPSNVVRVAYPNVIYAPGNIIQVRWNTSMERTYYTVPNNDAGMRGGNFAEGINQGGVIIRPLDITITPRSPDSFIFVEFNMFYECSHDVVFSVLRDGQLVGAQFQSGGTQTGQSGKWTGAAVSRYDNNNDSTPSYLNLPWIDCPGVSHPITYSIAAKSSNSTQHGFTLNCTLSNYQYGTDAYEQGVSFSIAQEIAY